MKDPRPSVDCAGRTEEVVPVDVSAVEELRVGDVGADEEGEQLVSHLEVRVRIENIESRVVEIERRVVSDPVREGQIPF